MRLSNHLCFIAFALVVNNSLFADEFDAIRQISSSDFSGAETIVTFYGATTNGFDSVTPEGVSIRTENSTSGIGFSYRNLPGRTGPSEPTALSNFYGLDQSSGYDALNIAFPKLISRLGMDIDRNGRRRIEFTMFRDGFELGSFSSQMNHDSPDDFTFHGFEASFEFNSILLHSPMPSNPGFNGSISVDNIRFENSIVPEPALSLIAIVLWATLGFKIARR